MTQIAFRLDLSTILAVFGMLVLFGIVYNAVVGWLERKGYAEGYASLLVVAGVLATIGGISLISWQVGLLVTLAFVASGTPMILGSVWRHVRQREQDVERIVDDLSARVA